MKPLSPIQICALFVGAAAAAHFAKRIPMAGKTPSMAVVSVESTLISRERAPASEAPAAERATAAPDEDFHELFELVRDLQAAPPKSSSIRRGADQIEAFERAWNAKFKTNPRAYSLPEEQAEMLRLCRSEDLVACSLFRVHENGRLIEIYNSFIQLPESEEWKRRHERWERVQAQIYELNRLLCRGGFSYSCDGPLRKGDDPELEAEVVDRCFGGNPDFCGDLGVIYLERYQQAAKSQGSAMGQSQLKEMASEMLARACDEGEALYCYDLVQGPLANADDPRSQRAFERLRMKCKEGDQPTACVTVTAIESEGDREKVADVVRDYCRHPLGLEPSVIEDDNTICSQLSKIHVVDDRLWQNITGLSFTRRPLGYLALPSEK